MSLAWAPTRSLKLKVKLFSIGLQHTFLGGGSDFSELLQKDLNLPKVSENLLTLGLVSLEYFDFVTVSATCPQSG
jgi:hypothetical protein